MVAPAASERVVPAWEGVFEAGGLGREADGENIGDGVGRGRKSEGDLEVEGGNPRGDRVVGKDHIAVVV